MTGSSVDPGMADGKRPRFPLHFAMVESVRCSQAWFVDFNPVPDFAGWFGAGPIATGESLSCRVRLTGREGAPSADWTVRLRRGADDVDFVVRIVAGGARAIPAAHGFWLVLLAAAFALVVSLRRFPPA